MAFVSCAKSPLGRVNMKMQSVIQCRSFISYGIILIALSSCASNAAYSPLIDSEPAADSSVTRIPRNIRLYYDALPDVEQSNVVLTGPAGNYPMRGLHTMAADDLMMEILDPLTPGEYSVQWTTVVGDDPTVHEGVLNFTVPAN